MPAAKADSPEGRRSTGKVMYRRPPLSSHGGPTISVKVPVAAKHAIGRRRQEPTGANLPGQRQQASQCQPGCRQAQESLSDASSAGMRYAEVRPQTSTMPGALFFISLFAGTSSRMIPQRARAAATSFWRRGRVFSSNQGCFFIQIWFLGEGCTSGKKRGR